MDKFHPLAHITVDDVPHSVAPCLQLILCYFTGFAYYVMKRFISVSISPTLAYYQLLFYYHDHHHVVPLARISLTLSLSPHFSISFIASGKSSGLHPVSSHSCCMYVRAGRSAFAWLYVGVHRSEQVLAATPRKAPTIRPPASYHGNYPS